MEVQNIFIVGTGRVATALAVVYRECGGRVTGVWGRDAVKAKNLWMRAAGAGRFGRGVVANAQDADVVLLCVSDPAIGEVARQLDDMGCFRRGQVVAHTSGSRGPEVLLGLTKGVHAAAFHPLLAIRDVKGARMTLPGASAVIEGSRVAELRLRAVADVLGMRSIKFAKPGDAGARARYHAAAVHTSNFLVTLTAQAVDVLEADGFSRGEARMMLFALLKGTVVNLFEHDPREALTGPLVRGDEATVARHVEALAGHEEMLAAYEALSEATRRLVKRGRGG